MNTHEWALNKQEDLVPIFGIRAIILHYNSIN